MVATAAAGTGSGPLDVVIVYGFDSTNNKTPHFYTVDTIYWMVQEKMLRSSVGGRLAYIHFWRPNTYTSDMKVVDSRDTKARGYKTSPIWKRANCEKKMASGLSEAQKLIGGDAREAVILFFSDGLVHTGDFFDGAEEFKAQVPVHTFTLGGDDYNQSLRTIAANSPGGTFNPVPVPEQPRNSIAFSGLLDSILTSREDMPPPREEVSNIGLVTMDAPKYSRDDVGLTEESLTVGLELKATTFAAAREGLDLVAVLDVSGSMKDKMDRLKKAMQFVIMKLTDKDRLSIVTFSDQGAVLCNLRSMTPAAQGELMAIVERLKEDGYTNITDGLEKGLSVIAGRKYKDGDRTPNIFLMSDGEQNRGGDADQVKLPDDVAVYTFGFGAHADHALLSKIASCLHIRRRTLPPSNPAAVAVAVASPSPPLPTPSPFPPSLLALASTPARESSPAREQYPPPTFLPLRRSGSRRGVAGEATYSSLMALPAGDDDLDSSHVGQAC